MNDIILGDERDSVTESKLHFNLDQYATLATRLDFLDVTPFYLDCHACHASHAENTNESTSSSNSRSFFGIQACLKWIFFALEEGHFEASQPAVGRITGWPQRMVTLRSLWVDFTLWCAKINISKREMPDQDDFYELLDHLFIRKDDKYELPTLENCRAAFIILRKKYECD